MKWLIILSLVLVGCTEMKPVAFSNKSVHADGTTGVSDPEPNPEPNPQPNPEPNPTHPVAPPDMSAFITAEVKNRFPGMINDCVGRPVANNFLIESVRALQNLQKAQGKKVRWGFFKKPDGRIPRDILAYAWGEEREGSHNTFVIDFVGAGCNNTPWDTAEFSKPADTASVIWINHNESTGFADNGVWSENPEF